MLDSGACGRAAVPSGASTGTREAVELRDGDKNRYLGKGVIKAVANVNGEIRKALLGRDAANQADIDRLMIDLDGTETKSRLGANALLAVSLATAHATAREAKQSLFRRLGGLGPKTLPVPMMNIINGGAHADNSVDIQEFMILPVGAPSLSRGAALRRGDLPHAQEGAARAQARDRGRRRRRLCAGSAVERSSAGDDSRSDRPRRLQGRHGRSSSASTSPARSSSRTASTSSNPRTASSPRRSSSTISTDWSAAIPIVTIEDGMSENDWDGWALLTQRLGKRVQLVGDDLFVTNTKILQEGIDEEDRQRDSDQAEPDRHADRDAGGDRHGGRCRLCLGGVASLRRDRGRDDRRHRGGDRAPRRSRPVRCRARIASPSTTSCCASKRSSAPRRVTPASKRSPCRCPAFPAEPRTMKFLAAGLLVLLLLLQYRLWLGEGGMREVTRLRAEIERPARGERVSCASAIARSPPRCRI